MDRKAVDVRRLAAASEKILIGKFGVDEVIVVVTRDDSETIGFATTGSSAFRLQVAAALLTSVLLHDGDDFDSILEKFLAQLQFTAADHVAADVIFKAKGEANGKG